MRKAKTNGKTKKVADSIVYLTDSGIEFLVYPDRMGEEGYVRKSIVAWTAVVRHENKDYDVIEGFGSKKQAIGTINRKF